MTDAAEVLPLAVDKEIDQACDRFEQAWKSGQRPQIEDVLGAEQEPQRSALLRELLRMELELISRQGETWLPSTYRERFPDHAHIVDEILEETAGRIASASNDSTVALKQSFETASQSQISETLGRFQIKSVLGAGAFGTVYRAYDPVLEREVALKVPQAWVVGNKEAAARFLREAKAAAQLTHPNIVPIYDASSDGGNVFIASKYIEGQTLEATIQQCRLDYPQAAELVRQLAAALAYAHEQGVVHRDIKPANIMLDTQGQPHIMDFGLARLADEQQKLTLEGSLLGTPAYMSPEQAGEPGLEVGRASDQYSLGVVLYELLCQQRPFSGPLAAMIYQIRKEEPPTPRTIRITIPKDLDVICLKAIAKEPARRYTDCNEFSEDLRHWQMDEPIVARRTTLAERLLRWSRRNPVMAGLMGLAMTSLVLVAIVSFVGYVSTNAALSEASVQREDAKKKQKQADLARLNAERQRDIADSHLYNSNARLADRALDEVQYDAVRSYLEQIKPKTGGRDHRGWEWYFLAAGIRRSIRELEWEDKAETIRYGFNARFTEIRYSPDARFVAALSFYGKLKLWDAQSGKELCKFPPIQFGDVRSYEKSFAWSHDSRLLAVGSPVTIFSIPDGQKQHTIADDLDTVHWAGWNPTGNQFVTLSSDRVVRFWDSADWSLIRECPGHPGRPTCGAFSHDGRLFVSGQGREQDVNAEKCLKVWDTSTGREVRTMPNISAEKLALHPESTLVSIPNAGTAGSSVWDIATGRQICGLPSFGGAVFHPAWSRDGKRLALPSFSGETCIWNAEDGFQSAAIHRPLSGWCGGADFGPNASTLFCAGDNSIVEIDVSGPAESRIFHVPHAGDNTLLCTGAAYGVSSRQLVSSWSDRRVRVWDVSAGRIMAEIELDNQPTCLAVGTEHRAALADGSNVVSLLDIEQGKKARSYPLSLTGINCVAWVDDESLLVATTTGSLASLNVSTGELMTPIKTPLGSVSEIRVSMNGDRLLMRDQSELMIYLLPKLEVLMSPRSLADAPILEVALSPDARKMAIAFANRPAEVWDIEDGRKQYSLVGYGEVASKITWSRDGRRLATNPQQSSDNRPFERGIAIWDAETGSELISLFCAGGDIRDLSWSPDNRQLAAADARGVIWVWDSSYGYSGDESE